MGLFDKFKKDDKVKVIFDEASGSYRVEQDGLIFSWDEKPKENIESEIKNIVRHIKNNYHKL